jgi:phthiocerol/phenolphthiocerol synthesis type-I polyketide synthase E
MNQNAIAIVGLSCHFPGARNVEQFWQNLRDGVESITFFSDEELKSSGIDPILLNDPNYVKAGAVLEDIEWFDAHFFGYSPHEARLIDPQQRMFLECAWEALEDAGYNPETYSGLIAVFAGASPSDYLLYNIHSNPDFVRSLDKLEIELGNDLNYLATRTSYKLNLRGPSFTVQTACSTSLVAVNMACDSLLSGQSDMALAGGVSISLPQKKGYQYIEGEIFSPDGHCRAFDANAQGALFSNGVGIVVVKRLADALEAGDHIYAVIKGYAINNDGSAKVGFTAPSVEGQANVISEALAMSGIDVETIRYVETHGTGTVLGDPIEIAALTQAFRGSTQKNGFCAIGSVKTNIGHAFVAAGIASLIKTVMMLQHKMIPPSLNFEEPNPKIDFVNSPFHVNTKLSEWTTDKSPRRAGVSSFGVGGTNAHALLEEAPMIETSGKSRPWQLVLLSAQSNTALDTATNHLVDHLKLHPDLNLAEAVYTLNTGRKTFDYRRMVVCQNPSDVIDALQAPDPNRVRTSFQKPINREIVFMFSGQGAQYVNMGLEVYRTESTFREEMDRCSEILKPHLSLDLRDILYPETGTIEEQAQKLQQTSITQPALFVVEYALAKLWMSWGINPAAMVGHSIGEYVAACLSGVFSLEDALFLVATRGRLMQQQPAGSMLAVQLSEKDIQRYLNQRLSLAAVNAPGFCVVSGETEVVRQLESDLEKSNVAFTPLHTSHAFHSEMMEPMLGVFKERVGQVRVSSPKIPFLSNLTGAWMTSGEAIDPGYWARHLRETVRFSDCIQELFKEPNRVLLEVGPGQTLSMLARQHSDGSKGRVVLSSIRHPKEQKSDIAFILNTLGRLWLAGVEVDWSGFYKDERRHRIPLPTYPFERQRYWIEPVEQPRGFFASQAGLGKIEGNSKRTTGLELVSDYLLPRDPEVQSAYVAPRNEVEQTITEIWQKLLGIKQIGVHDNYFDLGGTSVLAVRLFAQIEKIFGKNIPVTTLINAPTIGQLASMIEKGEGSGPWASLVRIQSGDSRPPFFFIHAAGGNVLNYRNLANHLGNDQPVFGLQSVGLDGEQPFITRIEDMATHYVNEIQTVQNKGPYMLGGYCLGGSIALEMAHQLQAKGEEVALLALLETYNWAKVPSLSSFRKLHYYLEKIEFHAKNFLILPFKEKVVFLREKARELKSRSGVWYGVVKAKCEHKNHSNHGHHSLLARLWENNDQAAFNYVPKFYPGKITIFLPKKGYAIYKGPDITWERLAREVETHELPVYPAGMLVEPFVQILAQKLKACIDHP